MRRDRFHIFTSRIYTTQRAYQGRSSSGKVFGYFATLGSCCKQLPYEVNVAQGGAEFSDYSRDRTETKCTNTAWGRIYAHSLLVKHSTFPFNWFVKGVQIPCPQNSSWRQNPGYQHLHYRSYRRNAIDF